MHSTVFFGCAFVIPEMSILAVMAYDQFVAVCNPLLYTVAVSPRLCSLLIILTSYVFIILTIIKMPSAGELQKAFSTCASHLTAITIFHGVILLLYWVPNSRSSWLFIKVATVLFTVVIPMLNGGLTTRKLVNTKMSSHLM